MLITQFRSVYLAKLRYAAAAAMLDISSASRFMDRTVITDCVRFLLQPWIPPAHGFFLAPLPEVG